MPYSNVQNPHISPNGSHICFSHSQHLPRWAKKKKRKKKNDRNIQGSDVNQQKDFWIFFSTGKTTPIGLDDLQEGFWYSSSQMEKECLEMFKTSPLIRNFVFHTTKDWKTTSILKTDTTNMNAEEFNIIHGNLIMIITYYRLCYSAWHCFFFWVNSWMKQIVDTNRDIRPWSKLKWRSSF